MGARSLVLKNQKTSITSCIILWVAYHRRGNKLKLRKTFRSNDLTIVKF